MPDKGSKVKVHYKGTLSDGTVFDSSEERGPLEFVLGESNVIPGFENAVADMEEGETKEIEIPSSDAYGEHRSDLVTSLPKSKVPDNISPEVGMMLQMNTAQGQIPVRVTEVADDSITLDANHPLAGEDLTFEITLLEAS